MYSAALRAGDRQRHQIYRARGKTAVWPLRSQQAATNCTIGAAALSASATPLVVAERKR